MSDSPDEDVLHPSTSAGVNPAHIIFSEFLLFVFGVSAVWFLPTNSLENVGLFLRTLVVAETSVVAIIFSIVVLGVQIISSRYTSRMGSVLFEDSMFQFTVRLLVIAVVMDLLLILFKPNLTNGLEWIDNVFLFILGISVGLSCIAYWFLAVAIRRLIRQSTPEGVLNSYAYQISILDIKQFLEVEDEQGAPPFQDLHSFVKASLEENERQTAKNALETYVGLCQSLVYHVRFGTKIDISRSEADDVFGPIIEEQFPEIAMTAATNGYPQIAVDTQRAHAAIAEYCYQTNPAYRRAVVEGHLELTDFLDENSSGMVLSMEIVQLLLGATSNDPDENQLNTVHSIRKELAKGQSSDVDLDPYRQIGQLAPTIHASFIDGSYSAVDEPHGGLQVQLEQDSRHVQKQKDALREFEHLLVELTYCAIKSDDEQLLEALAESWAAIVEDTSHYNSSATQHLPRIFVELALICNDLMGIIGPWITATEEIRNWSSVHNGQSPITNIRGDIQSQPASNLYSSVTGGKVELDETSYILDQGIKETEYTLDNFRSEIRKHKSATYWQEMDSKKLRRSIMYNLEHIEEGLTLVPPVTSGGDLIICEDSDGVRTVIKLVSSVNPGDLERLREIKGEHYDQLAYSGKRGDGAYRFRLLLLTPDHDHKTEKALAEIDAELVDFSENLFDEVLMTRQSTLDSFSRDYPDIEPLETFSAHSGLLRQSDSTTPFRLDT